MTTRISRNGPTIAGRADADWPSTSRSTSRPSASGWARRGHRPAGPGAEPQRLQLAGLRQPRGYLASVRAARRAPDAGRGPDEHSGLRDGTGHPRAVARAGDEILGHGLTNSDEQGQLSEDAERALIAGVTATIERHEGVRPIGWMSPWLSNSSVTMDLLQEAGYRYAMDCDDDQTRLIAIASPSRSGNPPLQEIHRDGAVESQGLIQPIGRTPS